uniref:RRM domain-containing protein n=1 Tax=Panagrellus redivivus TaxID=6233 RepID=A0A7E4UQ69_PANRE
MVKLFVGNLAENVDSHRLRNLFLGVVQVQECDVLKNFAFVHVATDEDATIAIEKLNKTTLEGREIHIERSTSRLRKEPGMSDKCFTCGALDHKTPQCPMEQSRRKKRPGEDDSTASPSSAKRAAPAPTNGSSCWGYTVGAAAAPVVVANGGDDAELPCPSNPELRTLYEQYIDSRSRYHFFRDRLSKELSLQPNGAPVAAAVIPGIAPNPVNLGRVDLTRASAPTPYAVPAAAPQAVIQAAPVYPGAQQTPSYGVAAAAAAAAAAAPVYRPGAVSAYPGVAPPVSVPAASYPGAQPQQPIAYAAPQYAPVSYATASATAAAPAPVNSYQAAYGRPAAASAYSTSYNSAAR